MLRQLHPQDALSLLGCATGKPAISTPFIGNVACGFPNQADEFLHRFLSLDKELVKNPEATVFARANGNSMINAGIEHEDVLVIDRGAHWERGRIAVVIVNGELTCKRLYVNGRKKEVFLMAENEDFPPIKVDPDNDEVSIFGVVQYVIKKTR